jgi:IS30 family transposase
VLVPRQISRHLERTYPYDPTMRVSHETIYTSLFVQAKGVLRPELTGQLRTRRVRRRPQRRMSLASRRNRIPNMRGIAERPIEVLDRSVAGHWEGDLLVGRYGRSHLVTLVERHSRYLLALPVPDATTVNRRACGRPGAPRATRGHTRVAHLGPRCRDD